MSEAWPSRSQGVPGRFNSTWFGYAMTCTNPGRKRQDRDRTEGERGPMGGNPGSPGAKLPAQADRLNKTSR